MKWINSMNTLIENYEKQWGSMKWMNSMNPWIENNESQWASMKLIKIPLIDTDETSMSIHAMNQFDESINKQKWW